MHLILYYIIVSLKLKHLGVYLQLIHVFNFYMLRTDWQRKFMILLSLNAKLHLFSFAAALYFWPRLHNDVSPMQWKRNEKKSVFTRRRRGTEAWPVVCAVTIERQPYTDQKKSSRLMTNETEEVQKWCYKCTFFLKAVSRCVNGPLVSFFYLFPPQYFQIRTDWKQSEPENWKTENPSKILTVSVSFVKPGF